MNNAAKLAATTNISSSHSSTVDSSSPPSPRPLDLTLKIPPLDLLRRLRTGRQRHRLPARPRNLQGGLWKDDI
ncbi:hypothetical protein C1H46_039409 [Malus baccata]|uniref:Uncharacterized protein n=1 Tax=Malus baccata TaxID=106549 RepID=A0A540KLH7_MALBA|nr:hypothetical protein C1H46_039409 [Malus baccata]